MVSGVHAEYDGSGLSGSYDSKTPGASGTPAAIDIYQFAGGANYWVTKMFRATLNYSAYYTPKSGSADNQPLVPGHTLNPPHLGAPPLHHDSPPPRLTSSS